jgi:hypothetical protein
MGDTFRIREVKIEMAGGVTITADVASLEEVKQLVEEAQALGLEPVKVRDRQNGGSDRRPPPEEHLPETDDPLGRVALKADLDVSVLKKSNVLGFKDGTPQLMRPNVFNLTDQMLVLLFALETGLKQPRSDFETFKGLYESHNIKSGSPFSMRVNDLKVQGHLDKKTYDNGRILSLTAKGEQKAIEALRKLAEQRA